jgi:hypothetical protein
VGAPCLFQTEGNLVRVQMGGYLAVSLVGGVGKNSPPQGFFYLFGMSFPLEKFIIFSNFTPFHAKSHPILDGLLVSIRC